jgi:hypothetical protein
MANGESTDWRDLCAAAAKEEDSAKLTSLVNQIIKAFDERTPAERTAVLTRGTSQDAM